MGIPQLKGRPSLWPSQAQSGLSDFFRSDHYSFWDAEPSLPAIFITDTADFRGYMKQCYHQSCDDMSQLTPDMLTFLARTTDSVVKVASNMTNEKCEMKKTGMVIVYFVSIRPFMGLMVISYRGKNNPHVAEVQRSN